MPNNKNKNTNKKNNDTFILVMPSFNEEKRIEKTIKSWAKIVAEIPNSEILIIDGDSKDSTRAKITNLQREYKFLSYVQKKREGYGKDLMYGYQIAIKSRHEWIFQADADSPIKIDNFYKLWVKRHFSPFIIGRRQKRKDPKYRLLLALLIEFWIILLFGIHIKDSNIPFRLIRKKYLKKNLHLVPQNTIAPNIFLSLIAAKQGKNLHFITVKNYLRNNNHNTPRILKGALFGFAELISFLPVV